MGLNSFSRCSCNEDNSISSPNPDPTNFHIETIIEIGDYTVAEINYPNCTNYEGNKILVYYKIKDLKNRRRIDPHFCDKCEISPIARFEPSERGWELAIEFVKHIDLLGPVV